MATSSSAGPILALLTVAASLAAGAGVGVTGAMGPDAAIDAARQAWTTWRAGEGDDGDGDPLADFEAGVYARTTITVSPPGDTPRPIRVTLALRPTPGAGPLIDDAEPAIKEAVTEYLLAAPRADHAGAAGFERLRRALDLRVRLALGEQAQFLDALFLEEVMQ